MDDAATFGVLSASLIVPPHPSFLEPCRTLITAMAARTDMGIDIIEDLRIAVDEAAALLLPHADGSAPLHLRIVIDDVRVRLDLEVQGVNAVVRDAGYGWLVLDAVADRVDVSSDDLSRISVERAWNAVGQVS